MQPNDQHINLIDAIDLILSFNETIQLYLVWKIEKLKNEWVILIVRNTQKLLRKYLFFSAVCIKCI